MSLSLYTFYLRFYTLTLQPYRLLIRAVLILTYLLIYFLTYFLACLLAYLLTYLLAYLLTPWNTVLLEKLTSFQLVKKFPAFYGT